MPAFNTRRVHSKRETALTSASAATAILAGVDAASIEWGERTRTKKYLTGNLNPADIFQQVSDGAKITISGDLSIEDGPILIDSGLVAGTSGASAGGVYTFSGAFPLSAAATVTPRTMEFWDGSHTNAYEANGCIITGFQLAGVAGVDQVVTFSANWEACAVASTAVTALTTIRTPTTIPTGKVAFYLDTAGATAGAAPTASTGTLVGWTLAVANVVHLKKFQDGSLSPTAYGGDTPDITLTTQLEVNTTSRAFIDANLTPGAIRALQIIGTASTSNSFTIKGPFDPVSVSPVFTEDRDGNSIVSITWKPRLDTSTTNGAYTNSLGGFYIGRTSTSAHSDT
jgi:hypothetical protein